MPKTKAVPEVTDEEVAEAAATAPLIPVAEAEPLVITDPRIDDQRFIFEGIDVSEAPVFTVSEVGKFFFARSPHWVRWRERRSYFVLDGNDPDCTHEDPVVIPAHTDESGKTIKAKTDYLTRIVDGVCPTCGGVAVGDTRTDEGARRYTLADVEKIAHALAQRGAISATQLHNALVLLHTVGLVYGHIA